MIIEMTRTGLTTAKKRLRATYIHHILWGGLCLVLFGLLMAIWFHSQQLNRQSLALEQQIAMQSQAPCTARDSWQSDTTRSFTIESNSTKRTYLVHLPKDFKSTQYYPAVLFFPGKGGSASDGERVFKPSGIPAVAIFPQPTIGKDGVYSWQGAPYSSGSDDVRFVADILDRISGQLCISRSHIYAAGMSNGGGMVSLLSCQMPDRIAAFGIVGGAFYYPTSDCEPKAPAPVINIHGDKDSIVPYNGSLQRRLPKIDDWAAFRATENDCSMRPYVTSTTTSVTTTWQFCRDNATVQNVKLLGVGHVWMTNATETVWNFFKTQSL